MAKTVECPYHKKKLKIEKQEDGSLIAFCKCEPGKYYGRAVWKKFPSAEVKEK